MRVRSGRRNERAPTPAGVGQPTGGERSDAFVSYCHADAALVRELVSALETRGKQLWIDWDDIPPSVDWLDEIAAGIDAADNFVCVISDDWIASSVCRRELEHAAAHNKRILPVLARTVDATRVPDAAAKINWIKLDRPGTLEAGVAALVAQMETDLPHVRGHTRWGKAAHEWERAERDPSYLLRGTELTSAEGWLAGSAGKVPAPTDLQRELLAVSRQAATRRQRQLFTAVSVALAVSVAADDLRPCAALERDRPAQHGARARARRAGTAQLRQRSGAVGPAGGGGRAGEGRRGVRGRAAHGARALAGASARRRRLAGRVGGDRAPRRAVRRVDLRPARLRLRAGLRPPPGDVSTAHLRRRGSSGIRRAGRLAVGGSDGIARVFEARTGERSRSCAPATTPPRASRGARRQAAGGRRRRHRRRGRRHAPDRRRRAGLGRRVAAHRRDAARACARRQRARLDGGRRPARDRRRRSARARLERAHVDAARARCRTRATTMSPPCIAPAFGTDYVVTSASDPRRRRRAARAAERRRSRRHAAVERCARGCSCARSRARSARRRSTRWARSSRSPGRAA